MALVGDNGAGKSTLIKCIAGIYTIDERRDPLGGRAGVHHRAEGLGAAGHRGRLPGPGAGRQPRRGRRTCTSGARRSSSFRRLDEAKMEQQALATLSDLSVTTIQSVRQPVATLSGGQRQSVAVAKAVLWNSKLVILDEPTAALGVAQTRQVLDLVRRLAEQGLAVVLISHNLSDVFEVADCITVLRLGQNVAEFKTQRDDPAGGRRGDHRRQAQRCARHARGGADMSTAVETPPARRRPGRGRAADRRRLRALVGPTCATASSGSCRSSSGSSSSRSTSRPATRSS